MTSSVFLVVCASAFRAKTFPLTARPPAPATALYMNPRRDVGFPGPKDVGRPVMRGASSPISRTFLLPNLPGVTESAEQGEDKPAGEVARDVSDISARDHFNEIVPDDPALGGHSTNQVRHLRIGHAARCRSRYARRDRRIQAVCVYGDVVAPRGRYPPQDFVDSNFV